MIIDIRGERHRGVSGRAMLAALAAGEEDPEVLAALARARICAKHLQLVEALRATLGPHQRELLTLQAGPPRRAGSPRRRGGGADRRAPAPCRR